MEGFETLWAAVEHELQCTAHDLSHVRRVVHMAETLAHRERGAADERILGAAAVLHDIARVREDTDPTRCVDHTVLGAEMAYELLREQGWTAEDARRVADCIRTHRFRSAERPETLEAKLLFDADKLDCLGAVGIARSFMIAGQYAEPIYISKEAAQANQIENGRLQDFSKHAPNLEFELKFRKIPDMLYTASAREIAASRMALMEAFFKDLSEAVEGSV